MVHPLQTGGAYPFTTAVNQVGPSIPYVVDLNDAVAGPCGIVTQCPVIVVTAKATGDLHDDPVQDDPFTVIKQLSGAVRSPFPDHFICYQLQRRTPNAGTVGVVDQFGSFSVKGAQAHQLCNPANKNNEDPNAPNDPNHLVMYDSNSTGNPALGHLIASTNQFGTQKMTLSTVQMIAVQSAKSLTGVPAALASPADNFVCYSVKNTGTFKKITNVSVQDQFGTIHVDLTGIRQFCTRRP